MTGRRVLLFITIFLFIGFKSFSAVFTVTSNADSGPGTLREALTLAAANGSTEKDFIYFNLPDLSEAGRTITLLTELPNISSNIVIDGTTQPGVKFGVSSTKVIIQSGATTNISVLIIDNSDNALMPNIEIYGLYIRNFIKKPILANFEFGAVGIKILQHCQNLIIGASGKGNIICGTHYAIANIRTDLTSNSFVTGLTVQNNIIGLLEDGISPNSNFGGINVIAKSGDILIGGPLPSQGNVIAANGVDVNIGQYPDPNNPFPTGNTAVIQSNMIGTGIDGIENYADHFIGQNPTAGVNYPFYGVVSELRQGFTIVKNNVISGHTGTGLLLRVSTFDIKGNKIGTDITGTKNFGNRRNIELNASGIVGGDNDEDKNYIAYGEVGGLWMEEDGANTVVRKNSFYCNKTFGIKQHDTEYAPAPIITSLTASSVSGTSKPGAVIELFHIAECTLCEGKEYIASVITGPDGKWLYHGTINKQVIATATFNNVATSEFSAPYLNVEIDESLEERKPASCNNAADGFIKHIKVKPIGLDNGPYTFTWQDASGTEVGSSLDLDGVPEGEYTLQINGQGCGSAYLGPLTLGSNQITLNISGLIKQAASCNQNNGTIKGITAPGATKYTWINTLDNSVVGTNLDLTGVPAGTYQLTASNDFGCSVPSLPYQIDVNQPTIYPIYTANINNSCAGQNNGSITVIPTDNLVKAARWIDAGGQPAGTGLNIPNLKPGTYKVYFTDANGCETLYPHDFTLTDIPPLQIVDNALIQTNDQCGLKTGSIKNIQVTGGTPPYTYLWLDAAGNHLSTSNDITGLGEGTYTLQVHDSGNSLCSPSAGMPFAILNENSTIDAPVINPLQLCAPGQAQLAVSSPLPGNTYRLYSSAQEPTVLDEQANGVFKINVNANSTYYISRVNGQCESERKAAQITVNLSAVDIPNAFTPNGDGKNDYWKINNAQNYPQAIVQVFTRYGQKVFESNGYSLPFDGTYNGNKLPAGVYYYILNLGKSCKLLSGNLTLIR
jgi:gliding motility-associated-like protein